MRGSRESKTARQGTLQGLEAWEEQNASRAAKGACEV